MTTTAVGILKEIYKTASEADYIGEPLSQEAHALQTAALASKQGDAELTLAALFHDIGHLCFPDAELMVERDSQVVGVKSHELLGADYLLSLGFSKRVAALVAGHVDAKRYLISTSDSYRQKMSRASRATLEHQGGLMSDVEVADFEHNQNFRTLLQLRAWDEAAKSDPAQTIVPAFSAYVEMIENHLAEQTLNSKQVSQFHQRGFVHLKQVFSDAQVERFSSLVNRLEQLPETANKWMKYFEEDSQGQRILCRVENFLKYEDTFDTLLNGPWMVGLVSQLMGETAVLFKEKINFKLSGAAGFEPHQDAPAFTSFGQDFHITMMLSFDDSTKHNGCLETVPGAWEKSSLKTNDDKTIHADVCAEFDWKDLPTMAGDIVLFGSYLPHRSGPNRSSKPRRALYATYNLASGGDVRDQYFEQKRRVFPPDIERDPNKQYSDAGVFNVGNPISTR